MPTLSWRVKSLYILPDKDVNSALYSCSYTSFDNVCLASFKSGSSSPSGKAKVLYHEGEFPAYNGTTARYITDNDSDYPTLVGKKTKLYSIPYLNNRNGE